jgi:hypothetical protein
MASKAIARHMAMLQTQIPPVIFGNIGVFVDGVIAHPSWLGSED